MINRDLIIQCLLVFVEHALDVEYFHSYYWFYRNYCYKETLYIPFIHS